MTTGNRWEEFWTRYSRVVRGNRLLRCARDACLTSTIAVGGKVNVDTWLFVPCACYAALDPPDMAMHVAIEWASK